MAGTNVSLRLFCFLLFVTVAARADSFTTMEVLQPGGTVVALSPDSVSTFTWTFAPNEIAPGSPAYAGFFFPIDPIKAVFNSSLSIDGFGTDVFSILIDARLCGTSPCIGIAALVLPRFYGTRSGSVKFEFGGQKSPTYHFMLTEPIPEPGSLFLVGTGLAAVWGVKRRRFRVQRTAPHESHFGA
jgi:hypothetical protein